MPSRARRVAVIGGGWAGLAAAVHLTRRGHTATVYEMAAQWGGRARRVDVDGMPLDNGQHILIGAYSRTLELMQHVGVDLDRVLHRMSLQVVYPDGEGLRLPAGRPLMAFARGVLAYRGWTWADKLRLARAALHWAFKDFSCPPQTTVAELISHLPARVRDELLDPLCIAALNTPADQACGQVFLRVLRDALFTGPGSADLLLPRAPLSALWPEPAANWLSRRGATLRPGWRVQELKPHGGEWAVDDERFDAVVLACTPNEAARLACAIAPTWSAQAKAFRYEPIVTVYARCPDLRLPLPMMALRASSSAPAQFAFDLGALGGERGTAAFVVSGASAWLERGASATAQAVLQQAQSQLSLSRPFELIRTLVEKRATFLCTPALARPPAAVLPGLVAAGDYVAGPYPATLEGAVRSGIAAAERLD